MDREALAQAAGEAMRREDRVGRLLDLRLEEVRPGYARVSMTVSEQMANAHALCHGGLIFTLADSSFGYASNSHNLRTLAANCSIEFLAPARVGDRLTAECREQALAGRAGIYDSRVTNQDGDLVALFRGKSAAGRVKWVE